MKLRLLLIYLLLSSIFVESVNFSFYFFGMRIRISQLIALLALLYLVTGWLLEKFNIKRTPIDIPLWSYMLLNIVALINAAWLGRSIKITLLLFSSVILYYIVVNLVNSANVFHKALHFLMVAGIIEIGYGLYQVLAGMLNVFGGCDLPIGYLGLIHSTYIGSPWGRPYGTFVEPDWYGTICMYLLLLFVPIYFDGKSMKHRKLYLAGLFFAFTGLFFSFVRAAWVGAVAGAGILVLYNIEKGVIKRQIFAAAKKIVIFIFLSAIIVLVVPTLRNVIRERIHPTHDTNAQLTLKNVRFLMMRISFKAFLQHPFIGNGPGSAGYAYLVNDYGEARATQLIKNPIPLRGKEGFDPSIITTILSDTGILGMLAFLWLLNRIIRINIRRINFLEDRSRSISIGLCAGFISLIVSYVFTQGLWLPFTWVFLALSIVSLKYGTSVEEGSK